MSDFLSQDEVDSLLKGVTGEPDEVAAPPDPEGTVRPYNMGTQERIVRGRMPTMEILNERFARLFRITLYNLIRRTAEISVGPIRVLKFSEFLRNLPVPTNINIVQAKPLRGNGLFIFDPNLIFLIVDNMFGGDGRFHTRVEGREFTQTEQRIIQQLLAAVFEAYNKAWQAVYALKFEFVRSEMNPQFANIATPNEVVVVTTFDIEFGGVGGAFHVLIPYSMIEPIREQLYSTTQGDHTVVDKRWQRTLSKQMQSAEIELTAVLGHAQIIFEQVLGMRNGDFIPLEIADSITVLVDEVPVMQCKYGVFNNQYALKVEKIMSITSSDLANGDNDG
ncbi:flagellar motor switch protein FliM [Candidatus Nitrotoga sp. BS]|uniref:flagellar motor switch protein FliM n=1 Tax=Candidatus Nitrotoga sp. BS TaxID=2890408 RepID=UPI001EF2F7E6|nr:flagellar motor switch protein FliM [Candidatus Nitrotoga sp. BS]CAH1195873.1 flagellar motor switch protein FliM [Candidatus Nitrotoga sp. BS]